MRRSRQNDPEYLRNRLVDLLVHFKEEVHSGNLRKKVLSLVPAHNLLRDLGSSLITKEDASSARDRIIYYMSKYPQTIISGNELMVVAGIGEWARRVRELRVQFGWSIISGVTAKEMQAEETNIDYLDVPAIGPDDYILIDPDQDKEAAFRWNAANEIRRKKVGVREKILEFLRRNTGEKVSGEELRYVANNRTEWARRTRELRTELGWPIVTKTTGRPDLSIGVYLLEQDRQAPVHDRQIPDPVRRNVLVRDQHRCVECKWSHDKWNRSDSRHLEVHHVKPHAQRGLNTEDNLVTLCNVCHDRVHSKK
jgi:hypothetical protein